MISYLPNLNNFDMLFDVDFIVALMAGMCAVGIPFVFIWSWGRKCIKLMLDFVFKGDINGF